MSRQKPCSSLKLELISDFFWVGGKSLCRPNLQLPFPPPPPRPNNESNDVIQGSPFQQRENLFFSPPTVLQRKCGERGGGRWRRKKLQTKGGGGVWGGGERICRESYSTFFFVGVPPQIYGRKRERERKRKRKLGISRKGLATGFYFSLGPLWVFLLLVVFFPVRVTG